MVGARGPLNKLLDCRERIGREGVDGGDIGEAAFLGGWMRVETSEEEDEQDKTVFAAIVGEGEFGELVAG